MGFRIKIITFLLIIICFNAREGCCKVPQDLLLVTNEFPPYTIIRSGEFSGIAIDIVKQLSNLTGSSDQIVTLPWKRALYNAKNKNVFLFPYTRQPYREKQFKWVGPIMIDKFVFGVNSNEKRNFNSIEDFRDLSIGAVYSTPTAYRLKELGFKRLQLVNLEKQNAFKLVYANRIDAWYVPELILNHTLQSEGIKSDKVKIAFKDIDVEMYIAGSLSVPDEIVTSWRKGLDDMKKNRQYHQILKKYGYEATQQ
ncbi:extracellular solute-binding protein, family 3 [Desulfosarcina variabilis str. Montpellier]|uniref:substrate-binding periplasmic protein n=1 Tax=Desulfosarcina variabilis TaxID=2300 RepID=UPI003AFA7FC4